MFTHARPHRRRISLGTAVARRTIAALAALAACVGLAGVSPANAANIRTPSTFACNWADYVKSNAVTVYFPDLYTSSGVEAVSFTPQLWKYTSSGWGRVDASKPWYSAIVTQNGVRTSNGFKWFINGTDPAYATGYRNVQFRNLSPGWYMVASYFYGGSSHWATVYGTNDVKMCQVL